MKTVQSADGTTIAYDQQGQGPALIIVAGALSTRPFAAPLAALLAPHLTVFTYDRRGRGDSGDTLPYAVAREVEDLGALIAAAGGSAYVYGHSSGAVLALEAARSGLNMTKLALYEPPLILDNSRPPVTSALLSHLQTLLAAGQRGEALAEFLTQAVGIPAPAVAGMRQGADWPGLERIAPTVAYDLAISLDYETGDPAAIAPFAVITAPALVMAGGASPAWMQHGAERLAATLPQAQTRTLAGQAHSVPPEVIAPVLGEFFNRGGNGSA